MEKPIRIGAFSATFEVPKSMVRYYIQLGLLIPKQVNGQYLFDSQCHSDMRRIEMWKRMRFSLDEIHQLISLFRKYPNTVVEQETEYKTLVCSKREELIRLRRQNAVSLQKVQSMLNRLPRDR